MSFVPTQRKFQPYWNPRIFILHLFPLIKMEQMLGMVSSTLHELAPLSHKAHFSPTHTSI